MNQKYGDEEPILRDMVPRDEWEKYSIRKKVYKYTCGIIITVYKNPTTGKTAFLFDGSECFYHMSRSVPDVFMTTNKNIFGYATQKSIRDQDLNSMPGLGYY